MERKKLSEDQEDTGSQEETKVHGNSRTVTPRERHFAKLLAETELGATQASRIAFGWRSEKGSTEEQRAKDLARAPRIVALIKKFSGEEQQEKEAKAAIDLQREFGDFNRGKLKDYAFKTLRKLRDEPSTPATTRIKAIEMLEKLHDPGKDINLIWKWTDVAWRYQTVHCPCCHNSFPLASVPNPKLDEWRKAANLPNLNTNLHSKALQQLELIKLADKRRSPHESQLKALTAPERHIIGKGAARAGKSYLLALFAVLAIVLPGVEIWILGETYDRTKKEVEYLKRFLNAIFYPHFSSLFNVREDRKTGETTIESRWGSSVVVKSAKSKGSITASAVELALCAEPGWLPADIYEELRARMSERLGRIIALGTPKGIGGFVGRMSNMTGRDPRTGKIIRWKPEDRLIKNDAPWEISLLVLNLSPEDNPEYVKSELDAARMELTDEEYASEFEGIGVSAEGMKFPQVRSHHLQVLPQDFFDRAVFVLGVDQGPKNFGACLTAFDGDRIVPCWEYFNSDTTTMKRNLSKLRAKVPKWINALGGNSANWMLTITDIDPPLHGAFEELEEEGLRWPTDIVTRHRNNARMGDNWRRENQEFINGVAKTANLIFHMRDDMIIADDESPGSYALHDQIMEVVDKPEDPEKESKGGSDKGWLVSDPWRADHVLDAWYFTMWAVYSQQLRIPERYGRPLNSDDPWAEAKAAFDYTLEAQERRELKGYVNDGRSPSDVFRGHFGYNSRRRGILGPVGPYTDEG